MGRPPLYLYAAVAVAMAFTFAVDAQGTLNCQFPFIYKGVSYSTCTTVDDPDDKPWCSTKTDGLNTHIKDNYRSCLVACGISITGDLDPTFEGQDPWMVHISYFSSFFEDYLQCGGSLLNKRYFITAAHCLSYAKPRVQVFVKIGYVNTFQPHPKSLLLVISRSDIIIHAEYDSSTLINDIALALLPQDVTFNSAIQPICLGTQDQIPFEGKARAAGWENLILKTSDTELIPETIHNIEVDVLAEQNCENSQYMICVSTVGQDACIGNGGGPLMVKQGEQWYLLGALSHGPVECVNSDVYTSYTRVPSYINWITSVISI